ncbi:cytochrome c oxidase polypeptide III [Vibrio variabilis]|uniref:Cytochrome c oxidase polypeptide III n=1 Tax=Vibrio variabilis TaxID=990271 RepID=A0ABQ0JH79_9VIBR|nr:cytochrome c oxidase polypeptide III [Vibrio variabilis]
MSKTQTYYVPAQSSWPIVGAVALFFVAVGAGLTVQHLDTGGAGSVIGGIVLALGRGGTYLHVFWVDE